MLDKEFNLVQLIKSQRARTYDFGDILVARAGTRQTATAAGASGRKVEDEIEAIAIALGLPYRTRTRYIMAVIDGIGWKNRVNDLRRIYALWESQQIDGMYTLATLDVFRIDLQKAAVLRGLHPPPGP